MVLIRKFNKERDWDQYHSAKNLAGAIGIEASELLEIVQWDDPTYDEIRSDGERFARFGDELADIYIYLMILADQLTIDLDDSAREKIVKNDSRYPADRCRGRKDKYHSYQ